MKSEKVKLVLVVGARPNFMKIAPLVRALDAYNKKKDEKVFSYKLVHTGQHYDYEMSQVFFQDLKIPKPDIYLGVGSDSHARQTAKVMEKLEPVLIKESPDFVLVVGDVNSTLAGALTAAKLHIPVAHVEAGLRSFDPTMPEEINRKLTDHLAEYLFTPSEDADENLKNEGIPYSKIFRVGNIMMDSLKQAEKELSKSRVLEKLSLERKKYALLTLHRPENVDEKKNLKILLDILKEVGKEMPIVFPVHPRARKRIEEFKFEKFFVWNEVLRRKTVNIRAISPLGYLDFCCLMKHAAFVLTDSGGIQEETTALQVPCLTLRETTERPITVALGTNTVVGRDKEKILRAVHQALSGKCQSTGRRIPLWDGRTAERVVRVLAGRVDAHI